MDTHVCGIQTFPELNRPTRDEHSSVPPSFLAAVPTEAWLAVLLFCPPPALCWAYTSGASTSRDKLGTSMQDSISPPRARRKLSERTRAPATTEHCRLCLQHYQKQSQSSLVLPCFQRRFPGRRLGESTPSASPHCRGKRSGGVEVPPGRSAAKQQCPSGECSHAQKRLHTGER